MRFLIHILGLVFIYSVSVFSQQDSYHKMDAYSIRVLEPVIEKQINSESILSGHKIAYPLVFEDGRLYTEALVKVNSSDDEIFEQTGCEILARTGDILAVRIPADNLGIILENQEILRLEASRRYYPEMDSGRKSINAHLVHAGEQLEHPYKGEGVITGILDTGIDFTHPDFFDEEGSRILYIWDMAGTTTPRPNGYSYGTEYTKDDIDNDLGSIGERDADGGGGHGTHVSGTAAGGGIANPSMMGIAPESDIIFVKGLRTANSSGGFSDADMIAGCKYIFDKAEALGRPCVINLSIGGPIGPHDGTALLDQGLSELTGEGRIIVSSAGNNGSLPIHAGGTLAPGENAEVLIMPINICEYFENFCPDIPGLFLTAADIWYDKGAIDSIAIGAYKPLENELIFLGEIAVASGESVEDQYLVDGEDIIGFVSFATVAETPGNGDGNGFLFLSNGGNQNVHVDSYFWTIRFTARDGGGFDLWAGIPLTVEYPHPTQTGKQIIGDNNMTVGSPGTAKRIISVGSYVTKNSWTDIDGNEIARGFDIDNISSFSSLGPTRDERLAPVITAPGQVVFAPLSSHLTEGIGYLRSDVIQGGQYQGMNGTSMASPHAAGAVALLLQADPSLDYNDIVEIFERTAARDVFTGDQPNNLWGNGKLDIWAALKDVVSSVDDNTNEEVSFELYPNPAAETVTVELKGAANVREISLYRLTGQELLSIPVTQTIARGGILESIDVSGFDSGMYYVKYETGTGAGVAPLLILR